MMLGLQSTRDGEGEEYKEEEEDGVKEGERSIRRKGIGHFLRHQSFVVEYALVCGNCHL